MATYTGYTHEFVSWPSDDDWQRLWDQNPHIWKYKAFSTIGSESLSKIDWNYYFKCLFIAVGLENPSFDFIHCR